MNVPTNGVKRNGNGNGRHGHCQLRAELQRILNDLKAVEELEASNRRDTRYLRAAVYADARRTLGLKAETLRALRGLGGAP